MQSHGKYDVIIFDIDGTLNDPKVGIEFGLYCTFLINTIALVEEINSERCRFIVDGLLDNIMEYILLIIPLVVLELSLKVFCIVKLLKEGSANLSKGLWLLIIILVSFFGPILFLTVGRRRDIY